MHSSHASISCIKSHAFSEYNTRRCHALLYVARAYPSTAHSTFIFLPTSFLSSTVWTFSAALPVLGASHRMRLIFLYFITHLNRVDRIPCSRARSPTCRHRSAVAARWTLVFLITNTPATHERTPPIEALRLARRISPKASSSAHINVCCSLLHAHQHFRHLFAAMLGYLLQRPA